MRRGRWDALEAADAGRLKALKLLHEHGADLHAVNQHGDGALELSRWARDAEGIKAFLKSEGVVARVPEHDEDVGDHHHHHHDHYGHYDDSG